MAIAPGLVELKYPVGLKTVVVCATIVPNVPPA
jgi:hypothetical protein